MQINDGNVHVSFEAYAQKSREAEGAPPRTRTAPGDRPGDDKVVLSPMAREISEARQRLDTLPDVDTARVNELRLSVETGIYAINGSQIAERMLQEMRFDTSTMG